MSNRGNVEGYSRDNVIWVVAPNSGVAGITRIVAKSGFPELVIDLEPVGNSNNIMKGTLIDVDTPAIEEYTIHYIKDDGSPAQYDPIIQVNPEPPLI